MNKENNPVNAETEKTEGAMDALAEGNRPGKRESSGERNRRIVRDMEIEKLMRDIDTMIRARDGAENLPSQNDHLFGRLKSDFNPADNAARIELITENGPRKIRAARTAEIISPLREYKAGDSVHVIVDTHHGEGSVCAVCPEEFYELFSEISNLDKKLNAMKMFLQLTDAQQKWIADQFHGRHYDSEAPDNCPHLKGLNQLKLKYEICKKTYTPQQQKEIEMLFSNGQKGKTERILEYVLNISPTCPGRKELTREELLSCLDRHLYRLDKVKEKIAECLIANNRSGMRGMRILLVGSPGTGKTSIAEAIAEAAGMPFGTIYLNNVISAIDLKGLVSQYNDSDVGSIVGTFFRLKTSEAVIILDELDKMGSGSKDGNPANALADTLSDMNQCYDAFLDMSIDTGNTIYIATANSEKLIPDFLLNRFDIIRIDDYEDEDKYEIAAQYIIPELKAQYGLSENSVIFSEDAVYEIIRNYCSDAGVRMLKDCIRNIIRKVVAGWDGKQHEETVYITAEFVKACLERFVDDKDPHLIYARHKDDFSPAVRREIRDTLDRLSSVYSDPREKETDLRRVKYLTSLIPGEKGFEGFDFHRFIDTLDSSHYGLSAVKKRIAMDMNAKAIQGASFSSERILLVGPPGIGKTSICKSIAAGLGVPHVRIPLNGISDESVLKGFPPTYLGADAGEIYKGLARVGTGRAVVQLDEIDKLGNHNGINVTNAFADLLDDSASFIDHFLGVPVDLSDVLFIATANDISQVEPWLLDRFHIIELNGYTKSEKESILRGYIIPRIEKEFAARKIKVVPRASAVRLLISKYCSSMGVRDLEKAARDIVNSKLYDAPESRIITIRETDIADVLGPAPLPRGNLVRQGIPGVSKALAVSGGSKGLAFSVETVVLPDAYDSVITGLPKESTIDSVKLAKTYVRLHYAAEKNDFGIHLHFGEGAVVKDGPSAGVAILVSVLSAVCMEPVAVDAAYTGEIDLFGNVFPVGGILAKIQAAEESGCVKVFIPADNYAQLNQAELDQFSTEIVPVRHVSEVIRTVFPSLDCECRRKTV